MKIRIDIRTTSQGFIDLEYLEDLEDYDSDPDEDLVEWTNYKEDFFQVTVNHEGKDHHFETTEDAIEFIKTQTPD